MSGHGFFRRAIDHPHDAPAAAAGAGPEAQIDAFVGSQVEDEVADVAVRAVHRGLRGKAATGRGAEATRLWR